MKAYPILGRPPKVALAQQRGLIFSDDYLDGWAWGFKGIGCEVREWDITGLQNIHYMRGSAYSAKGWGGMGRGIAKEMAQWGADLVFVHHGRWGVPLLDVLNSAGIRSAVYLCDEPYECGETVKYAKHYTHVFTMDPCTLDLHRRVRGDANVHYLPPAANTDRFHPGLFAPDTGVDGLFLGNASLTPRPDYFHPLEAVGKERGLDISIRYWTSTTKHSPNWIPLERYPELYARAKIGLNVHRLPWIDEQCWRTRVQSGRSGMKVVLPPGIRITDKPPARWGTGFWNDFNMPGSHVNPRFFELAAMGTFQISDNDRSELARMFPEAIRCSTPEEFLDRFFFYLDHPKERREIAHACCQKVLTSHTYRHRAAEALVRAGLWESTPEPACSSLGEPREWMTPQECPRFEDRSCSAPTGPSSSCPTPPISRSSMPWSGGTNRVVSRTLRPLS